MEMPFDKQKNQRKAFCFITFDSEQVVNELLKTPKQTISGKEVDVKKATPKPENAPMMRGAGSGGRNMRFGGRGGGRGKLYLSKMYLFLSNGSNVGNWNNGWNNYDNYQGGYGGPMDCYGNQGTYGGGYSGGYDSSYNNYSGGNYGKYNSQPYQSYRNNQN
jgi:squid